MTEIASVDRTTWPGWLSTSADIDGLPAYATRDFAAKAFVVRQTKKHGRDNLVVLEVRHRHYAVVRTGCSFACYDLAGLFPEVWLYEHNGRVYKLNRSRCGQDELLPALKRAVQRAFVRRT